MKRKHNEGYVLIMVLVALVVLSLLCAFVMSNAVQNLHFQKVAAQRMSDKYAAQGEIERITALLESAVGASDSVDLPLKQGEGTRISIGTGEGNTVLLHVNVRCGSIQIACTYTLQGESVTISVPDNNGNYTIKNLTGIQCTQPEITTAEEETTNGADQENTQ